jgi:hypothetical protein
MCIYICLPTSICGLNASGSKRKESDGERDVRERARVAMAMLFVSRFPYKFWR